MDEQKEMQKRDWSGDEGTNGEACIYLGLMGFRKLSTRLWDPEKRFCIRGSNGEDKLCNKELKSWATMFGPCA